VGRGGPTETHLFEGVLGSALRNFLGDLVSSLRDETAHLPGTTSGVSVVWRAGTLAWICDISVASLGGRACTAERAWSIML
jgi:hypothetical protein